MKLGIDIDGTIKNTHKIAIEVFNKELNQSVTLEEATDFYLDKAYGLSSKEGKHLWKKLEETIYTLGLPLDHASEVLNELVKIGHKVFFITARPDVGNIKNITHKWLKDHGFPYTGNNLIMDAKDKAKVAKELNIELFFEDAPDHLQNLLNNNIRTVIVDALYNRHFPETVQRIHDWLEVYNILNKKY
jgi:uncharacterized protein